MAQIRKSTPVAPSSPLRWQPYLGSEILGLGIQANSGRTLKPTPVAPSSRLRSHPQARSGGNCTLGLKSMAQVLKPTPVAQVDANGRIQAHSGGTSRLWSQS
jgi:hypothetical protein